KDKFFANLSIVVPAAVISLLLYCLNSPELHYEIVSSENSFWLVIPYFLVILLAVIGINVIVVLLAGIISAFVAGYFQGIDLLSLFSIAGDGIEDVGGLIIITLLASGMLGFIKKGGGIEFIIQLLGKNTKGKRGAQFGIVGLVSIVNLCTANNTVAILTVGSMAKRIAGIFHISPKKTASLLDSGSCVTQSLIPYGAQSLMAASIAGISPAESWQFLYYPQMLFGCILISIVFGTKKH
ncbi:MAG: Na+/H+ antiporter NhaC family protein, partial [Muribaculaceae bacterium]|nr:Na+/H+ antiporter NhaC family protein [Muribaculaceae bacterium]